MAALGRVKGSLARLAAGAPLIRPAFPGVRRLSERWATARTDDIVVVACAAESVQKWKRTDRPTQKSSRVRTVVAVASVCNGGPKK